MEKSINRKINLTPLVHFCYTMYIMKKEVKMINFIKQNGLLDWDFVSTISVFVIIFVVSAL